MVVVDWAFAAVGVVFAVLLVAGLGLALIRAAAAIGAAVLWSATAALYWADARRFRS